MNLFLGVAFVCLGAVLFKVTFIGARSPRPSKWFDGFVYLSLLVISILTLPMIGLYLLVQFFDLTANEPISAGTWLLSAAAVVGTILFVKPARRKLGRLNAVKASH